jgi:hypothetical protein
MTVSVTTETLVLEPFKVNALCFIPKEIKYNYWAIFSHGYTAHKGSLLNWAIRLSEFGIPCIIHDQPGHYLGSFNEVESFEDFTANAHRLYAKAYELLQSKLSGKPEQLIIGGHSLGGLTAIKALELPEFKSISKMAIAVGLGIAVDNKAHFYETGFFKKALGIRNQLVSPAISSDKIFAWVKAQKEELSVTNHRIHIICGKDDLVVGEGGAKVLQSILEKKNNNVTIFEPTKLAHHTPEAASGHIMSFFKFEFNL